MVESILGNLNPFKVVKTQESSYSVRLWSFYGTHLDQQIMSAKKVTTYAAAPLVAIATIFTAIADGAIKAKNFVTALKLRYLSYPPHEGVKKTARDIYIINSLAAAGLSCAGYVLYTHSPTVFQKAPYAAVAMLVANTTLIFLNYMSAHFMQSLADSGCVRSKTTYSFGLI